MGYKRSSRHRALPHNPAEIKQNAAEQKRPEAKRIQKRKSYIARTDLQWDNRIHQRENDRHNPEKNHRCPMHRNQFVKGLGIQKGIHRLDQLDADQNGLQPANAKKIPPAQRYKIAIFL